MSTLVYATLLRPAQKDFSEAAALKSIAPYASTMPLHRCRCVGSRGCAPQDSPSPQPAVEFIISYGINSQYLSGFLSHCRPCILCARARSRVRAPPGHAPRRAGLVRGPGGRGVPMTLRVVVPSPTTPLLPQTNTQKSARKEARTLLQKKRVLVLCRLPYARRARARGQGHAHASTATLSVGSSGI